MSDMPVFLRYGTSSLSYWCPICRDVPAVEYETAMLSHNVGRQSLSNSDTFWKNGDLNCGTAEANL